MTRNHGISLLEILIAVAILGVGILALFILQARSLQYGAKAEQLTSVLEIARAEMEWRVKTSIPSVTAGAPCNTRPGDSGCTVTIVGCNVVSGSFTCGVLLESPIAYQVTVAATGFRGDTATLTTVSTGYDYIAGSPGDLSP